MANIDVYERNLETAVKAMEAEKYSEAFFYWTKAIRMAEQLGINDLKLYINRAKCFLQAEQYYYAMQDANHVLTADPDNILGHLRKAEIFYETGHLLEAIPEIGKCFDLATTKEEKEQVLQWQKKCRSEASRQRMREEQLPYVGAAVGIVISSIGVVADALAYGSGSYIAHPVLKALVVMITAGTCYLAALFYRYKSGQTRKALLAPPPAVDKLPATNGQLPQKTSASSWLPKSYHSKKD